MKISLNGYIIDLPENMTVEDLIKWKEIPSQGTAVALNNKLIKQNNWSITELKEKDQVTIISAAYGG